MLENKKDFFVVYLANIMTSIRIWRSLHSDLQGGNMNIIQNVLQTNSAVFRDCCLSKESGNSMLSHMQTKISYSNLSDCQKQTIQSCIALSECHHQNAAKLIWGPPGTGKTKTVGLLLYSLLKMECRTVTCAPTNIAVLEVTSRLMRIFMESLEHDTYGLGDIILFGNRKRMKISENDDLLDIFLDYRSELLYYCLAPTTGWKHCLETMINLLKDPESQYRRYLGNIEKKNEDGNSENEDINRNKVQKGDQDRKSRKDLHRLVLQIMRDNDKKEKLKQKVSEEERDGKNNKEQVMPSVDIPTFEEYVKKEFKILSEKLDFLIVNLYTHLPTSIISLEMLKIMFRALDLLSPLGTSIYKINVDNEGFKQVLNDFENEENEDRPSSQLITKRRDCLQILKSLPLAFDIPVPFYHDPKQAQDFILENACLLFCTASSSSRLHTKFQKPIKMLIIDEAAQLKECESTIPLQLNGLRHAILIGDDRQLPAMVQSKISEKADFGRSLFERLVSLGQEKQLLNMQYRMHPSISIFPNKEFYGGLIQDAQNVKERNYQKQFLQGKIYGSYSFINIANGQEKL